MIDLGNYLLLELGNSFMCCTEYLFIVYYYNIATTIWQTTQMVRVLFMETTFYEGSSIIHGKYLATYALLH